MKTYLVKYLVAGLGLVALNLQLHAQGFVLSSTPGVGNQPVSVVAADVNGDGKMDLICANTSDKTLTVFTNDGGGILLSNASYAISGSPVRVVAADLNGDGKVDLVCLCALKLMVLTNNGSGGFATAGPYYNVGHNTMTVYWFELADVNGDNKLDLISQGTDNKSVLVLTNAGDGTFTPGPSPPTISAGSWFVKAVDINGDGKADLIDVPNYISPTYNSYVRVLTNAGAGTFILSSTNTINTYWPGCISAADVNGDGCMDVIISDYHSDDGRTLMVLTNNGHGVLGSNAVYIVGNGPRFVATADVNGDGMVDLISKNEAGLLTILTNNGSGFGSNATLNVGSSISPYNSVLAADVNGDGRLDLITANNNTPGTLSILTNALSFLPKLTLKCASSNVVVSWPSQWTPWAGWTLQQNYDLNPANWTSFGGTIGDDGTTKTVTNSSPTGTMLFRLSHP